MLQSAKTLSAIMALLACGASGAADDPRPDNYIGRARWFLRALYPGLDTVLIPLIQDHNRLGDPDEMNLFLIELYEPDHPLPGKLSSSRENEVHDQIQPEGSNSPAGCRGKTPVIGADFDFDWQTEDKPLVRAWVWGPAVRGRLERFVEEVARHPEWPERRVLAALRDAGAKFAPDHKADFLRALPIQGLKPFVGALEVKSAEFRLWEPAADGRSKAELTWIVRGNWHSPDGRQEANWVMAFEPFEGRLLRFMRDISPHVAADK